MTYNYRSDPILGPALEHWIGKCGTRSMPRKRDIDPTEIPRSVLPHLQIIDVIDGGARFRFRLIGSALVAARGNDCTGKYAEEILPDDRLRLALRVYRTVCETKAPLFSRNRYYTPRRNDLFANRIYMPLSDDGINVHHIIAALVFETSGALDDGIWGASELDRSGQYNEPIEIGSTVAA